jgi:hypothetical protein
MYLSTLLLGLNAREYYYTPEGVGSHREVLGPSVNLRPFMEKLGWTYPDEIVNYPCAIGCQDHWLRMDTPNLTSSDGNKQFTNIGHLFYLAAKTPGYNWDYVPSRLDKETLIKLANTRTTREDGFLTVLINQYNRHYPGRTQRILRKDLPSNWYYTDTQIGKVLLQTNHHYTRVSQDVRFSQYILVDVLQNLAKFKQMCLQEYVGTPINQAPCEILSYNTKVERYLQTDMTKGDVLFGVELELEGHTATRLSQTHSFLKDHCIFKRDGSISNGMEIVSRPASIADHKRMFKPFFDANLGYEAMDNCGIHIHASRGKMSFLQLGRIHAFLSNNKGSVIKIAGRESSYARFGDDSVLAPWYRVSGEKYTDKKRFNWDKYTAVNLAPENTMEFRIFKSTTNWDEFCRFLEFPDALISYLSLAGNDNRGKIRTLKDLLMFENFKDFVAARGRAYPQLNKFIQKECV